MDIEITARHFELTEAIKEYVIKKVQSFNKYLKSIIDVHVILSLENDIRHIAEIIVTARDIKFIAKEHTEDLYASVDKAVDAIEKQLRHHKERVKEHHSKHGEQKPLPGQIQGESSQNRKQKPSIILNRKFLNKPMDAEEAAMELELQNYNFLIFKDSADNDRIKVIYKRKDGNFGLIEPL